MAAADELAQDARRVAEFPRDAVARAVRSFAEALRPRVAADTGGDNRLSGLRDGDDLRVNTRVDGYTIVEGLVSAGPRGMRGPWRWLDDGTRPRDQGAGRHPGTPARNTFSDPVEQTMPVVITDMDTAWRLVIR